MCVMRGCVVGVYGDVGGVSDDGGVDGGFEWYEMCVDVVWCG